MNTQFMIGRLEGVAMGMELRGYDGIASIVSEAALTIEELTERKTVECKEEELKTAALFAIEWLTDVYRGGLPKTHPVIEKLNNALGRV